MKHLIFLFIGGFFLGLVLFHQPLSAIFPQVLEPVNKFIHEVGPSILYLAGSLSLIIAIFIWLPTWASIICFILLVFTSGWYLKDKEVSIRLENENLYVDIVKKSPTQEK